MEKFDCRKQENGAGFMGVLSVSGLCSHRGPHFEGPSALFNGMLSLF